MDSQAGESSSRVTQLEKEILKLKKENENLRALNKSLQQGIFSYLYFLYQFICQCGCLLVIFFLFFLFFFFKEILPMLKGITRTPLTLYQQPQPNGSSQKNLTEKVNKNIFSCGVVQNAFRYSVPNFFS